MDQKGTVLPAERRLYMGFTRLLAKIDVSLNLTLLLQGLGEIWAWPFLVGPRSYPQLAHFASWSRRVHNWGDCCAGSFRTVNVLLSNADASLVLKAGRAPCVQENGTVTSIVLFGRASSYLKRRKETGWRGGSKLCMEATRLMVRWYSRSRLCNLICISTSTSYLALEDP